MASAGVGGGDGGTVYCDRCGYLHLNYHRDECDCAERGIPPAAGAFERYKAESRGEPSHYLTPETAPKPIKASSALEDLMCRSLDLPPPEPAPIVAGRRYRLRRDPSVTMRAECPSYGMWLFTLDAGGSTTFDGDAVEPIPEPAVEAGRRYRSVVASGCVKVGEEWVASPTCDGESRLFTHADGRVTYMPPWWVEPIPEPERFEAAFDSDQIPDCIDGINHVLVTHPDGRTDWARMDVATMRGGDRILVEAGDPWRIVEVLGRAVDEETQRRRATMDSILGSFGAAVPRFDAKPWVDIKVMTIPAGGGTFTDVIDFLNGAPDSGNRATAETIDELFRKTGEWFRRVGFDPYAAHQSAPMGDAERAWQDAQSGGPVLEHRCPHCSERVTYHGARAGGRHVCNACGKTVRHG